MNRVGLVAGRACKDGHTRDRPAWGRLALSVGMCTAPPGTGDKTGAPQDTLTAPAKFQAEGPRQAGCRIEGTECRWERTAGRRHFTRCFEGLPNSLAYVPSFQGLVCAHTNQLHAQERCEGRTLRREAVTSEQSGGSWKLSGGGAWHAGEGWKQDTEGRPGLPVPGVCLTPGEALLPSNLPVPHLSREV